MKQTAGIHHITAIVGHPQENVDLKRLDKFNIEAEKTVRFGETSLRFSDTHGLQLELVERGAGEQNTWQPGDITPDVAIKGFAGAALLSARPEITAKVLEQTMGFKKIGEEDGMLRFQSTASIGNIIDLPMEASDRG